MAFNPLTSGMLGEQVLIPWGLLLLIGVALRLCGRSIQSPLYDETSRWYTAQYESLSDVARKDKIRNVYPPACHFMLHYVILRVGDSEAALRMPSAFAGLLSIPLVFLVGARLCSPRRVCFQLRW
jgi:4-amino-4-deoxy-L-arabinose transferase-like glycosyltransferase